MNGARVTIGIPVFNEASLIERAIRSAATQCERLIVSDNASSDGTEEICRGLLIVFPNMEYIRQTTNIGALKNWQSILDKVDTPYFMMLGSHDYIDGGYVQKLLGEMQTDATIVAAFGQLIFEYEDRTEVATGLNNWNGGMHQDPVQRVCNLLFDRVHAVWATYGLFRTESFKKCFTDDLPPYGADAIFLSRVLALGRLKIAQSVYYHAWMRDTAKSPSDYLERITAKKKQDATKSQLRNEFRIAQFDAISRLLPHASIWTKLSLRFQGMVRFGVFKKPGVDPLFFILYMPTKLVRLISRIGRSANQGR